MIDMSAKKVLIICGTALLISIVIEILFAGHKAYFWWHGIIGFNIVYGFLGCIVIVSISKLLGKAFIQRDEDYYDGDGDDNV